MKKSVYNGCDRLDSPKAKELLSSRRLGLLTNVSGVTRSLRLTAEVLKEKYNLAALFAPEHGIRGAAQDNHVDPASQIDPVTGIPVYNLCNLTSVEAAEQAISTLDAVVVDIQDIGVRYHTYQFAMLDAMKLCAKSGVPLIVLDRFCPIGGQRFGGQLLEEGCTSVIGRVHGQPVYSGMTIGEVALWFNAHLGIGADVSVIRCQGWERGMWFDDTDHLFVLSSPNMTSLDCNLTYIAICLFEQTTISEGRGTTKPFELFGAPWMDPEKVVDAIKHLPPEAKEAFEGLIPRPLYFKPTFHKYQGELCGGIQLHVRDRHAVDPYAVGLHLLTLIRNLYPNDFVMKEKVTHTVGTRQILNKDFDPLTYLASQKEPMNTFGRERKKYLLY